MLPWGVVLVSVCGCSEWLSSPCFVDGVAVVVSYYPIVVVRAFSKCLAVSSSMCSADGSLLLEVIYQNGNGWHFLIICVERNHY